MSKTGKHLFQVGGERDLLRLLRILAERGIKKHRMVGSVRQSTRLPGPRTGGFLLPSLTMSLKKRYSKYRNLQDDTPVLLNVADGGPGPVTMPGALAGFARERATYERSKGRPPLEEGKYVVIKGDDILGPMDTYEDALRQGYARFGLGPMYVKQVSATEPVATSTRPITPCPI